MTRNPAAWLTAKAKTGVVELPRNAAWVASKTLGPAASAVADGAESAKRAWPNGDRVDARLDDARAAVDRAHQAEREAVAKAQRAHELAVRVQEVEQQHRERLAAATTERDQAVEARVADARRRADEAVEAERAAAEGDEAEKLRSLEEDLAAERRDAEAQAQAAQEEAREDIASAEQQMAEGRRISDEAAEAAMQAAKEAHQAAEELATRAEAQATDVDDRVRSAQALRRDAAATTSALEKQGDVADVAGPLSRRTVAELMPIAAGLGIEGRSRMRHDDLVAAITRARSRVERTPKKTAAARKSTAKKQTSAKRTPTKKAAATKAAAKRS